jgi:hypothetical protein
VTGSGPPQTEGPLDSGLVSGRPAPDFNLLKYKGNLIGKGGTRTLDPGIMSAVAEIQVADFPQVGQTAVAAECPEEQRCAEAIPAYLPRTHSDCRPVNLAYRRASSLFPGRENRAQAMPWQRTSH